MSGTPHWNEELSLDRRPPLPSAKRYSLEVDGQKPKFVTLRPVRLPEPPDVKLEFEKWPQIQDMEADYENKHDVVPELMYEIKGDFMRDDEERMDGVDQAGWSVPGSGLVKKAVKKTAKAVKTTAKVTAKVAVKPVKVVARPAAKFIVKPVAKFVVKPIARGVAKGAKVTAKVAVKTVKIVAKPAEMVAKFTAAQLAAAAKAVARVAAYPIRAAVKPIVVKTSVALAGSGSVTRQHRVLASQMTIKKLKASGNPMVKFAGVVLAYVGTGVSGDTQIQCMGREMIVVGFAGTSVIGLDPATISSLSAAASAAVAAVAAQLTKYLVDEAKKMAISKAKDAALNAISPSAPPTAATAPYQPEPYYPEPMSQEAPYYEEASAYEEPLTYENPAEASYYQEEESTVEGWPSLLSFRHLP